MIHKRQGVSLIELMVALAISSILLLGVGTIYSNSKKGYRVQEEFATLQENARIAMKFLVTDIRMAGFVGCAWNNNLNYEDFLDPVTGAGNNDFATNFRVGLEGFEAATTAPGDAVDLAGPTGGWDRALPDVVASAAQAPLAGSDVILVRRARGTGIKLAGNKDSANFRIADQGTDVSASCHAPSGICEGDILLVTDCTKSRMFQASALQDSADEVLVVHNASGTPGNNPTSWGGASDKYHHFGEEDSEIFKASAFAYYIGISNTTNEPTLFRLSAAPGAAPEELVEGVENMQVLYGIDTDKDSATDVTFDGIANRYVTADQVVWANDNVVSARISFLLRSKEVKTNAATPANPFKLGGTTAASSTLVTTSVGDRRVRKVFTITVKLRNKGLT